MNGLLKDAAKIKVSDFASIPYASIIRAREERKHAGNQEKNRDELLETAWQKYPTTPREQKRTFNLDDQYWNVAGGGGNQKYNKHHNKSSSSGDNGGGGRQVS